MLRNNTPWLLAATVPLAYLTKSLMIPVAYLNVTLYWLLYTNLTNKDCYYCRPNVRDLPAARQRNGEPISLSEMHQRRTVVMQSVFQRYGGDRLSSLEDLNAALTKEVQRVL